MLTFIFIKKEDSCLAYPEEFKKFGLAMCFDNDKNAYGIVRVDNDFCIEWVNANDFVLICARMMQGDDV